MAATRNVSVWTPKPDTTAVDRGSISYDLFDKNVVKMHSSNIEFLNYQNDFCQGLLVNLKLNIYMYVQIKKFFSLYIRNFKLDFFRHI